MSKRTYVHPAHDPRKGRLSPLTLVMLGKGPIIKSAAAAKRAHQTGNGK